MIYNSDFRNNKEYEIIKVCNFLKNTDIELLPNGHHMIDGDDFYVNIFEYQTKDESECIWEAHRQYFDVHYIITGEEIIKIGKVDPNMITNYDETSDYVALTAVTQSQVLCRPGTLLFLDQEDAHLTGAKVNGQSTHVRKAVFKIRIK